jgi:hypothetical protein
MAAPDPANLRDLAWLRRSPRAAEGRHERRCASTLLAIMGPSKKSEPAIIAKRGWSASAPRRFAGTESGTESLVRDGKYARIWTSSQARGERAAFPKSLPNHDFVVLHPTGLRSRRLQGSSPIGDISNRVKDLRQIEHRLIGPTLFCRSDRSATMIVDRSHLRLVRGVDFRLGTQPTRR